MERSHRWWAFAGVILCLSMILSGCGSDSSDKAKQAQQPTIDLPNFTSIVKTVSPAVVNISAMPAKITDDGAPGTGGNGSPSELYKHFFGPDTPDDSPDFLPHVSLGSGFIISSDGYILTNRHVIRGAGRIVVKLSDRRQLIARVVGSDKYTDVALLKVDADKLPAVRIGDPDKLEVGAWVLAIGSPFGFDTSVTAGIVSAKGRTLANEQYVPFIQTDVAINPGNSGGPLFNLSGQVVGINSQIYSRTGGYQGVSFSIPIDVAMNVAHQIETSGSVKRGWLGVQIQDVGREMARAFGLERPRGALVSRVFPNSPAAGVGVHSGDIILKFNGHDVPTAGALPPLVGSVVPGDRVPMTILRDGRSEKFRVRIGTLPKQSSLLGAPEQPQQKDGQEPQRSQGLTLEPLDAGSRKQLGIGDKGVRVGEVRDGAGARAGLKPGDIILAVGKQWIDSPAAFARRMADVHGMVALLVLRDGNRLFLALRPQNP